MRVDVLTIFPQMIEAPMGESIIKRAKEAGLVQINVWDIRQFTSDKHRRVDDAPYGGGAGMVMKAEPFFRTLEHIIAHQRPLTKDKHPRIILMTPQGRKFDQKMAQELVTEEHVIFLCGHYEGIDDRVRRKWVTDEVSIGDYVLTGGELAAAVVIDAVVRLLPGALGDENSVEEESFSEPLVEYPHFTRPAEFEGLAVPEVLLSGHHGEIALWRRKQSLLKTFLFRPDLLSSFKPQKEDWKLLKTALDELPLSEADE